VSDALSHEESIANGVRLHYVAAGDPEDPLVVLLHGFPEFWYAWHRQLPDLAAAGYRVVAPDMRGYNRSEKPHGVAAYDRTELVADVAGLIDAVGRDRAHLVGHDWGGMVAWDVAAERPDLLASLTVLNAPHPNRFRRALLGNPTQLRNSWYILFFQAPWLPERLLSAGSAFALRGLADSTVDPDAFSPADLRRYRRAFARPGAARSAINYYRAALRRFAREELSALVPGRSPRRATVSVPTLLLWGEQDDALDVSLSAGVEEWVTDLTVRRFPDASHWLPMDAPERVSEALLAFLDDHRDR